jgi:heme-degrading monooxygenase HmoA
VILRLTRIRVRHGHEEQVFDVLRRMTASMGAIPGLRSADDMWFVAITRWDSVDAIRAVYGDSWPYATILPGAESYVLETWVEHFETTLEDVTEIVDAHAREVAGQT